MTTGNAARLLDGYLSVVTRGVCSSGTSGEQFVAKSYDARKAYVASSIKGSECCMMCLATFLSYAVLALN